MKTTGILGKKTGKTFLALAFLLAFGGTGIAAEYVSLKIFPEHVGVFTADGQQQFVAIAYDAAGNAANVTDKVIWKATGKNGGNSPVTIDQNGLATVISTSGQAIISASYPEGRPMSSVNHLLLNNLLLKPDK